MKWAHNNNNVAFLILRRRSCSPWHPPTYRFALGAPEFSPKTADPQTWLLELGEANWYPNSNFKSFLNETSKHMFVYIYIYTRVCVWFEWNQMNSIVISNYHDTGAFSVFKPRVKSLEICCQGIFETTSHPLLSSHRVKERSSASKAWMPQRQFCSFCPSHQHIPWQTSSKNHQETSEKVHLGQKLWKAAWTKLKY